MFTQRIQCESCENAVKCHETSARYGVDELPEPWLVIAFAPVRGSQYLHFCSMTCALAWLAKRIGEEQRGAVPAMQ